MEGEIRSRSIYGSLVHQGFIGYCGTATESSRAAWLLQAQPSATTKPRRDVVVSNDTSSAKPAQAQIDTPVPSADGKTVSSSSDSKFPTPAELLAKIKQIKDDQAAMPQVAYFDLGSPLTEKPSEFQSLRRR